MHLGLNYGWIMTDSYFIFLLIFIHLLSPHTKNIANCQRKTLQGFVWRRQWTEENEYIKEVERMCKNVRKSRGEQEGDESRQRAWRQRNENQRQTLPWGFIIWVSSEEVQRYAKNTNRKCYWKLSTALFMWPTQVCGLHNSDKYHNFYLSQYYS